MAANFTLCMPFDKSLINSAQPVLNGQSLGDPKDQAPTGAWAEVAFAELANQGARGVRGALVHISTDVTLRFAVSADVPAHGGTQLLGGGERTVGLAAGLKFWIK